MKGKPKDLSQKGIFNNLEETLNPRHPLIQLSEKIPWEVLEKEFSKKYKKGGRLANLFKRQNFKTFARTGDIYSLFYEKGWQILKDSGALTFITSNKWMRAAYGKNTREFFAIMTQPILLIDFAGVKVDSQARKPELPGAVGQPSLAVKNKTDAEQPSQAGQNKEEVGQPSLAVHPKTSNKKKNENPRLMNPKLPDNVESQAGKPELPGAVGQSSQAAPDKDTVGQPSLAVHPKTSKEKKSENPQARKHKLPDKVESQARKPELPNAVGQPSLASQNKNAVEQSLKPDAVELRAGKTELPDTPQARKPELPNAVGQPSLAVHPKTSKEKKSENKFITSFTKKQRNLPHWQSPGAYYFITFSTSGHVLSDEAKDIIYNSALHFNNIKYALTCFVVMDDHVHLILSAKEAGNGNYYSLSEIMHSLKSYTSTQINKLENKTGRSLWLPESYDRIIRNENELFEKMMYILNNPVKAGFVDSGYDYKWFFLDVEESASQVSQAGKPELPNAVEQPSQAGQNKNAVKQPSLAAPNNNEVEQ